MAEEEFRRWYWLKDELMDFARGLGIRATGSKKILTERIAATLGEEVLKSLLLPAKLAGSS